MRYYFDVNGVTDEEGTDLPGPQAVAREALGLVLAIAADGPEAVHVLTVVVRDQQQRPVYQASLKLEGCWQDAQTASARR